MKNHNRIFIVFLAFVLVFSLIFTGTAAARNAQGTAVVGTTDDEIERGVAWEMLNSECFSAEDLMHAVGNDFSDCYRSSLYEYYTYAKQLLNSSSSTTAELNEMYDDLQYIISEQRNPSNHTRFGYYTVVFTNNGSWSDPIYFYNWSDDGGEILPWPGEAINSTYTNEYGQKQYYTFIPMDVPNIVISSDQLESTDPNYGVPCVRVQTEDITVFGNTGFYLTGERDSYGHYKVAEWELKSPVYKKFYTDPDTTVPTEEPTVEPTAIPTEPPTEAPTEPVTELPTESATEPATEPSGEFHIDDWIPRNENLEVYDGADKSELQSRLYQLIVHVDQSILAPGNIYTPEYTEKLSRIRNFAAFVYNDRRADDNELTGALNMLQMAIDNKSYVEIVDCMKQWFNLPDIERPDPTEPATPDPTEPTTVTPPGGQYEDDPITNHIVGDADGDGEVTILDATKIQRVLAGYNSSEKAKVERYAAVTSDTLSILDATIIQRWLAGFTTPYSIGDHFKA